MNKTTRRNKSGYFLAGLLFSALLTGCALSNVGFIPDSADSSDFNENEPTLTNVRKWAAEVADGYDSRATMNRYATYVGGSMATLSIGAITGLATFNMGHSWILGLPLIGATSGALFALYQNEEKARIYRLANLYIKDLITISNRRVLTPVQNMQNKAQAKLDDAQYKFGVADDLYNAALKVSNTAKDKVVKNKRQYDDAKKAKAPNTILLEQAVTQSELDSAQKQRSADAAESDRNTAKVSLNSAKEQREIANQRTYLDNINRGKLEASCLQDDVNKVMGLVEEHVFLLDPQNVAKMLQEVKKDSTIPIGEQIKLDLSDLKTPAISGC